MGRSILLAAQSKVHEHAERDAAVRRTKNVTDWSAPPPPPAGQLAVTAAPSRRGWTLLADAWPAHYAQHQQQHAADMTKSHMDGFISARTSLTRKRTNNYGLTSRSDARRWFSLTVAERWASISVCEEPHRRDPCGCIGQTGMLEHLHSPPENDCWNVAIL